jgi:membrane-associated protein
VTSTYQALDVLSPNSLISTFGVAGVLVIIFIELAVIIGFFLPGDSLLFIAGVAASGAANKLVGTHLNFPVLLIATPIVAIVGSQIGHFVGAKFGRRLFDRPDSRFFKRKYAVQAEFYFNKYGGAKAVFISRFIVGVRTFVNPLAGMLEMSARKFFLWSTIGNVVWVELMLVLGYELGDKVKGNIDDVILPIAAGVAVLTLLPLLWEMRKERKAAKRGEETELQIFEREAEWHYQQRIGGGQPQAAGGADAAEVSPAGARHRK